MCSHHPDLRDLVGVVHCISGLVVSSGHHSSTIIPIIDGQIDSVHATRLELGGVDTHDFMMKLMHMKYPLLAGEASCVHPLQTHSHHRTSSATTATGLHLAATSPAPILRDTDLLHVHAVLCCAVLCCASAVLCCLCFCCVHPGSACRYYRAKELVEQHAYIPTNYMDEIRKLEGAGYLTASTHCIQLPTAHLFADLALKKQRKDEQSRKQKDRLMHISKRQGGSSTNIEAKLAELTVLHQNVVDNKSGSKRAMRSAGFRGVDALIAEMGKLNRDLLSKKQLEEAAEQAAADVAAAKVAAEKARPKTAEELRREADPEEWLVAARAEVDGLVSKQAALKSRDGQSTDRKSRESKKRMRLLVQVCEHFR